MKFKQGLKMALSSVKSNKMRSFLTMLGIIIGVMAVTLLVSLVQGATNTITDELSAVGGSNLSCMIMKYPSGITLEEVEALEQEEEIGLVSVYMYKEGIAKASGNQEDVTIYAINQNYQLLNQLSLESGRYLTTVESEYRLTNCMIGAGVAQNLFGNTDVLGETIRVSGKDFTIVGVLQEDGSTSLNSNDFNVFFPYSTGMRLIGLKGIINFDASAADEASVGKAEKTLNTFLRSKVGEDNYTVINMGSLLEMVETVYNMLGYLLGGIAGISLLVGGVGIMNIMLVSVTERTKEIGIRKAIGAQKSDIIVQFLIESVVLSLMGGFIGIVFSAGILGVINLFATDVHFSITLGVGMLAVFFSVGVGVLFGIYPANKAAKLKPIDALRFE